MTEQNDVEETKPITLEEIPLETPEPTGRKRLKWWIILIGVGILLFGAGVGIFAGYQAGLDIRRQAQSDQVVMNTVQQYELGVVDLAAGRYEMARQRFEFVISLNPNFPGAREKLTEAMMAQAIVYTPTPQPTATIEPTPDLRGEEEIFTQIQQHLMERDWAGAIAAIERLRDKNLEYRAIDVDGMYYIALRFLGVDNILSQGQLEVGIYNLTLAERFAPLDIEALNYRNWARLYLSAASFWAADWGLVVRSFADLYPALPNLRDSSGMTATERFRIASIRYGDQLMLQEQWCDAQRHYENALAIANDPGASASLAKAADYCANPPQTEEPPPPAETATPPTDGTPPGDVGEVTPTPEATQGTGGDEG